MQKQLLFLSGNNIDKRDQILFNIAIEKDTDIHRLIRTRARIRLFWKRFLKPTMLIPKFFIDIIGIASPIAMVFAGIINGMWLPFIIVVVLFVLSSLSYLLDDLGTIRTEINRVNAFKPFLSKDYLPKYSLELWHLYPASIIDAQIAQYTQRVLKTADGGVYPCSLYYAGIPYAKPILVDSIDFSWQFNDTIPNDPHGLNRWFCRIRSGKLKKYLDNLHDIKVKRHFNKIFNQYSIGTMIAEACQEMFAADTDKYEHRQKSDCVFGVLFSSFYFKNFIEDIYRSRSNSKKKIKIVLSPDIENVTLTRTVLQFIANPSYFTFNEDEDASVILYVKKLRIISKKELPIKCDENCSLASTLLGFIKSMLCDLWRNIKMRCNLVKYWGESLSALNIIHLPIKKVFLAPLSFPNKAGDMWFLDNLKLLSDSEIVILGGAEQNLLQCHLLNRQRWSNLDVENEESYFRIGFCENELDFWDRQLSDKNSQVRRWDYLAGIEGFIHGYDERIIKSMDNEKDKLIKMMREQSAELMYIDVDGVNILLIYGYSAIATKIASAYYFYYRQMATSQPSIYGKFLPVADDPERKRVTYEFYNKIDATLSVKSIWDAKNPLDNPFCSINDLSNIVIRTIYKPAMRR